MPIKFRCPHCQQFLGISRSRAGAITDCPTCGRSIRVPLLDGTVPPLPDPELNLADQGLASALDKLAGLAEKPEGNEASAATEQPSAGPAPGPVTVQPIPLPEPIALPPAPAPVVIEPPPPVRPPREESPTVRAGGAEQVVAAIAAPPVVHTTPAEAFPQVGRGRLQRRAALIAVAAGLTAAAFTAGYGVGRRGAATAVSGVEKESPPPTAPVPAAAPPAAPPAVPQEPALTGRISYIASGGEIHPDAGARVLVLPEERQGSLRLPADGLRPGANEQDLRVAVAAIRALGGDFCVADAEGRYAIHLPQAGLYQVLILSRYQPRDGGAAYHQALQFLTAYVDRPAQVLGETAVQISPFRYRGSGTTPRDHTFEPQSR